MARFIDEGKTTIYYVPTRLPAPSDPFWRVDLNRLIAPRLTGVLASLAATKRACQLRIPKLWQVIRTGYTDAELDEY